MEFTGLAGQILGWVIMITAYAIVAIGIFCLWSWIWFEVIIKKVFTWLKLYDAFVNFIWKHRRRKSKADTPLPEATNDGGFYYDLFKFFSDEHGLVLVDTEIQDIIHAVNKFEKWRTTHFSD